VPLVPNESLWVAWTIRTKTEVTGCAANGEALRIVPVTTPHEGWLLLAADAIEAAEGPRPIDVSLQPTSSCATLAHDHLTFKIINGMTRSVEHLGVVLGTPELYTQLSGLLAPEPTKPSDAYGGWRLP
jgi:hypothetical protein